MLIENASCQDPINCARIVPPTEWARRDISKLFFYNNVFNNTDRCKLDFVPIEKTDIVQRRAMFSSDKLRVWGMHNEHVLSASIGTKVLFASLKAPMYSSDTESPQKGWPVSMNPSNNGINCAFQRDDQSDLVRSGTPSIKLSLSW